MTTVAIVLKNADFTEGRGPMVFDKVFDTVEHAEAYIATQPGIYGSKQGKGAYGWNGYDVMRCEVYGGENWKEIMDKQLREEALKKLSPEERRVLGL